MTISRTDYVNQRELGVNMILLGANLIYTGMPLTPKAYTTLGTVWIVIGFVFAFIIMCKFATFIGIRRLKQTNFSDEISKIEQSLNEIKETLGIKK